MSELIDNVLNRLDSVRKNGKGYIARCPAHNDGRPSLTIKEVDGKVLLHCFAGCTTEEVITSIGLTWKDMFEESLTDEQRDWCKLRSVNTRLSELETILLMYSSDISKKGPESVDLSRYAAYIQEKNDKQQLARELKSRLLNKR